MNIVNLVRPTCLRRRLDVVKPRGRPAPRPNRPSGETSTVPTSHSWRGWLVRKSLKRANLSTEPVMSFTPSGVKSSGSTVPLCGISTIFSLVSRSHSFAVWYAAVVATYRPPPGRSRDLRHPSSGPTRETFQQFSSPTPRCAVASAGERGFTFGRYGCDDEVGGAHRFECIELLDVFDAVGAALFTGAGYGDFRVGREIDRGRRNPNVSNHALWPGPAV